MSAKRKRPALFFANGIGDHFLSLPAIRALEQLFPGRLALVCQLGASNFFASNIPGYEHLNINI